MLLNTKASFSHNDKLMRLLMTIAMTVWCVHDYIVGSPVAVLIDIVFIVSCAVGYYRIYGKKPILVS
ncbi:YgjV family protein [Vibrio sp. S11_S32]|nr:YgjV family protein [Vibrio sp. S11_S32]